MAYLTTNYRSRRDISDYYNIPKVDTTNRYFIIMDFPFNVLDKYEFLSLGGFSELSGSYRSFNRRLTAEKCRMNALKEYYDKIGNIQEYKNWVDRYNNIELEHPEWLI